jgi:hypothetical protein
MTAYTSAKAHLTRCTLFVAVTAVVAVAGSVWANSNGQPAGPAPGSARIDIAALLSNADIANLPVLNVEQPF